MPQPALRDQLKQLGLGRMADAIEQRSQPSIRLLPGEPSTQRISRLGGHPNLPAGVSWPLRKDGQPLAFVAQLEVSTLPRIPNLPLPSSGFLFFFYDAMFFAYDVEEMRSGLEPADAQVVYAPQSLAANEPREPHPALAEEFRYPGFALEAAVEMSLPSIHSGILREYEATREETEAYFELLAPWTCIHRMGGHPDETQGPIILEGQFVSTGIYWGDGKGYLEARKWALEAGAADWRLLLQVGSEERAGMFWGDAGRIYFLIREDDLRHSRFGKIWQSMQFG